MPGRITVREHERVTILRLAKIIPRPFEYAGNRCTHDDLDCVARLRAGYLDNAKRRLHVAPADARGRVTPRRFDATLAAMPDDAKPVPFPVEVAMNGVRVTVTLMLKPGTTVTVEETKTTTEPVQLPDSAHSADIVDNEK